MTVVWPRSIRARTVGVATGTMADIDVPARPPPAKRPPRPRPVLTVAQGWTLAEEQRRRRRAEGSLAGGSFHDLWQPGCPGYAAALALELADGRAEALAQLRLHHDALAAAAARPVANAQADAKAAKEQRRRIVLDRHDHELRIRGRIVRPSREREEKPDMQGGQVARYAARGEIGKLQHTAAMQLVQDYWNAGGVLVIGRLVGSYGDAPPRTGGAFRPPLTEIEGRQAYESARDAVGPAHAGVLEHVVILGNSARSWAEAQGWAADRTASDKGIKALRVALDRLAAHYRLT